MAKLTQTERRRARVRIVDASMAVPEIRKALERHLQDL